MTTPPLAGRRTFAGWLADHNPFYLLSAASMLGGCLALTNTLSWDPVPLSRILILIVTINVYEAMLVGLAAFLIARRRLYRDGMMLLFLEALFPVDVAFLNSEVFALDFRVGWMVNALVFAAAVAKVYMIFRVLGLPVNRALFAFVLAQLAVLFAIPGIFKWLAEGRGGDLPPLAVYLAWWVVAMLPVAARYSVGRQLRYIPLSIARMMAGTLLVLPVVSLIAHLGTQTWVYDLRFHAANLAPLFLAAAVLTLDARPSAFATAGNWLVLRLVLPAIAILVSLDAPHSLWIPMGIVEQNLSPLMLAVAGAYLVYVFCFARRYVVQFMAAGVAAGALALFGPSVATLIRWGDASLAWVWAMVRRLMPQTTQQWGIVAVVGAFVLLAIGAFTSLSKRESAPGLAEPATPADPEA